jgi:probable addiction module antidote protein
MTKQARPYVDGLEARLQDPAYAAEYLSAAADEGKAELLMALRDVARARGVALVARDANRGRESLYKALSEDGNPELDTFLSVLAALRVKLHFEAS